MLHIHIAAVGRARRGPEQALFEHYADRLRWPLTVTQVQERRKRTGEELKAAEAALLLEAVPKGAVVVALDERGRELSSPDFAQRLERWRDQGRSDIAFIIGGADRTASDGAGTCGSGYCAWPHDLAAHAGARPAGRADIPRTGNPGGPPLPPGMTHARILPMLFGRAACIVDGLSDIRQGTGRPARPFTSHPFLP